MTRQEHPLAHGLIFKAAMVQALLAGRKLQTRRAVAFGSFNFTRAAEQSNAENLRIERCPATATRFLADWDKHHAHSEPPRSTRVAVSQSDSEMSSMHVMVLMVLGLLLTLGYFTLKPVVDGLEESDRQRRAAKAAHIEYEIITQDGRAIHATGDKIHVYKNFSGEILRIELTDPPMIIQHPSALKMIGQRAGQ